MAVEVLKLFLGLPRDCWELFKRWRARKRAAAINRRYDPWDGE